MTIEHAIELVSKEINDTADDINAYLMDDVPLECHQTDISWKLEWLERKVTEILKQLPASHAETASY